MTVEMYELKKEVNNEMVQRFPFEELNYLNAIVASIIAKGRGYKLTEDWLRRVLLTEVEDGFMTYGQIMTIKDDYYKAIVDVRIKFEVRR